MHTITTAELFAILTLLFTCIGLMIAVWSSLDKKLSILRSEMNVKFDRADQNRHELRTEVTTRFLSIDKDIETVAQTSVRRDELLANTVAITALTTRFDNLIVIMLKRDNPPSGLHITDRG